MTLLILAAGLGTRFKGGIKQLTPIGPKGELIIEYSIYDATQNAQSPGALFTLFWRQPNRSMNPLSS